jgi:hypothetical protein
MHECQSNDWQSTNKERAIKQVCKEAITVDFKDARISSGLLQCAKLRTHAKESNLKTYVVSYLFMTSATIDCLNICLAKLINMIKARHIPHYITENRNMFNSKMTEKYQRMLLTS